MNTVYVCCIPFVADWQHLFSFSLLSPNEPVATDNILLLLFFFLTGQESDQRLDL